MSSVALYYFAWHYTRGTRDFVRIWGNLVWFVWHFFSIGLLLSTWIMPFKRIRDERTKKGFDPGQIAESIIVNILMRIVGFIVRTMLIVCGLVGIAFLAVFGTLLLAGWLLAPVAYLSMMGAGLHLLFS